MVQLASVLKIVLFDYRPQIWYMEVLGCPDHGGATCFFEIPLQRMLLGIGGLKTIISNYRPQIVPTRSAQPKTPRYQILRKIPLGIQLEIS